MTAASKAPSTEIAGLQNALAREVLASPDTASALAALVVKEVRAGGLDSGPLADLAAQVERFTPEAQEESSPVVTLESSSTTAALLATEAIKTLVTQAGGIFIGIDELVKLGKISPDAEIPALPKTIEAFLQEAHPIRGRTIASHIILAFDPESNAWQCIDRGEGGKSDIVPASLGPNGYGLSGAKQDGFLKKKGAQINVLGAEISSPADSYPVKRVLDNAIALHVQAGKRTEDLPFYGIWGRTADTTRAAAGCRVLLGYSFEFGGLVDVSYPSDSAYSNVGLLAAWNLKNLDR